MSLEALKLQIVETEKALASTNDKSQPIYQVPSGWVIQYRDIEALAEQQAVVFWPGKDPDVPADIHDIITKATDADRHAIMYSLKLFTLYELMAGQDYWLSRFSKSFQRPEFLQMSTMFAAVEFNSHANFYTRINELLYCDTEEFFESYKEEPELVERMDFIGTVVSSKDDLISTAGFSFVEGAILYSNFAFFKSFQHEDYGRNLIRNVCRGINQSVVDENTHAVGSAMTARHLLAERNIKGTELKVFQDLMIEMGRVTIEHETHIIHQLFSKGDLQGITIEKMINFVTHRVNLCLENLGILFQFEETETEIKDWFYDNINAVVFHDFFTGGSSEYQTNINREAFTNVFMQGK